MNSLTKNIIFQSIFIMNDTDFTVQQKCSMSKHQSEIFQKKALDLARRLLEFSFLSIALRRHAHVQVDLNDQLAIMLNYHPLPLQQLRWKFFYLRNGHMFSQASNPSKRDETDFLVMELNFYFKSLLCSGGRKS